MEDHGKIPVRLLATTPQGDLPLKAERGATSLPVGPHGRKGEDELRYGPYLEAVSHLLAKNNYKRLLEAVSSRLGHVVIPEKINLIEIRTEKHGVSYHVARVDVYVAGQIVVFAVNVAASPEARDQLERDYRLLNRLTSRYHSKFLPGVYFKGAGCYRESGKTVRWLHMFVAEWFRDFHEFHLHRDKVSGSVRLLLWDLNKGSRYLSQLQCLEFYRQAAKILTLYYNLNNSKQIYPWHHAAGDFVLNEERGRIDVRLITVRNYDSVVDFSTEKKTAKLLALILFFLHLSIQMRLDRLDGVGEVVWAEDYCLEGVVTGFFAGLAEGIKRRKRSISSVDEIRDLFCSFSREEWLQLLVELLATYTFSREEFSLIRDHGDAHIDSLQQVLKSFAIGTL